MPTNLAIDENLLSEALKVGGFKTKKNTVNEALKEFIRRRKQKEYTFYVWKSRDETIL